MNSLASSNNTLELAPNHLYWPEIDVDLTVEMIKHPEQFPLKTTAIK